MHNRKVVSITKEFLSSILRIAPLCMLLSGVSSCIEKSSSKSKKSLSARIKEVVKLPSKASSKKQVQTQTETEMLISAQKLSEGGNHKEAAQTLAQLMAKTKDKEMIQDLSYKRAKQLFLSHDWPAASRSLENFAASYKDDPRNSEVQYMNLFAKYQMVKKISIECDAGETHKVLSFAQSMLQADNLRNRKNDILGILRDCQDRLLSKAISTYDFYLRRGDLKSARIRLDKIKEEFSSENFETTAIEPRIMYLECKLAKAQDNHVEAESISNMLCDKYPESKFVKMAQTHLNADKFWSRFGISKS